MSEINVSHLGLTMGLPAGFPEDLKFQHEDKGEDPFQPTFKNEDAKNRNIRLADE